MALTKITPQMFDTSAAGHDFNIDNGTFVVDASANRVGIGTATPSTLLDVNGVLTATSIAGTLTTAAQTNITSVGTLSSLTVSGALNGTLSTAAQTNITSVGTLSALTVTGTLTGSDVLLVDSGTTERSMRIQNSAATAYIGVEGSSANRFVGSAANNMFLGTTTADGIQFATNNNVRAVIDSSGNVGIGASNPSQKLHVVGKIKSTDDLIIGGANPRIDYDGGSSGALRFFSTSANLERMRIDSDGHVGIGTIAPSIILHVKEAGSTSAVNEFVRIENSAGGGAAAGSSINFHHYHAGGGPAGGAKAASITAQNMDSWAAGTPSGYSSGLTFGTIHANTFDERMRITSDGNVGIGTSSPSSYYAKNLVVMADGDGTGGITIAAPATDDNTYLAFADGTSGAATYAGYVGYSHSSEYLFFGAGATTAMYVKSGNLGIGTNSPLSKLNVKGTQGNWRVDPDSVSNEIQVLATTTANDGFRDFRLRTNQTIFDVGGSEAMRISGGNVGIGTNSPSSYLAEGDDLVVANTAHSGITIASGTSHEGGIFFADGTSGSDRYRGMVRYSHASDYMQFYTAAGERLRINARGALVFNPSSGTEVNNSIVAHTNSYMYMFGNTAGLILQNNTVGDARIRIDDSNLIRLETTSLERMRIQNDGHIRVNPGAADWDSHSNVGEHLFSVQTSYNSNGDQNLNIVNHNGNWLDGTSGGDTAYGLMWGYQNSIRAGIHYDHRSVEKFDFYSTHGAIRFRVPPSANGNISPIGSETTMPTALEVHMGGSVNMPKQPVAIYTHVNASEAGAYGYSFGTSSGAVSVTCKPQSAVVNRGSMYTPSNGRFTAPKAGVYRYAVHGNLYTGGIASTAYWTIRTWKNTSHYIYHYESNSTRAAGGWIYVNAGGIIEMAESDYITFQLVSNNKAVNQIHFGWDLSNYTHYEFQLLY